MRIAAVRVRALRLLGIGFCRHPVKEFTDAVSVKADAIRTAFPLGLRPAIVRNILLKYKYNNIMSVTVPYLPLEPSTASTGASTHPASHLHSPKNGCP